jgi:tetratricopeptide (TPR) repeat protein
MILFRPRFDESTPRFRRDPPRLNRSAPRLGRPRPRLVVGLLFGLAASQSWAAPVSAQGPTVAEGLAGGRSGRAQRLQRTGQALVLAGNPLSAVSFFRRAIQVDPSFVPAYVELANVYLAREGGALRALEVVEVGRRRHQDNEALSLVYVRVLRQLHRDADAARVLRHLVQQEPDSAAAHALRAELARSRGAWSEALASYRAVLRLAERGTVTEESAADARRNVAALQILTRGVDPIRTECEGAVRAALCDR